jgi:hypothetical protein
MKRINIAREYSEFPVGRFYSDGPDSGERFRDEFLEPALRSGERVVVELSGTEGYGSSFLDEAFGGVVRKLGLTQAETNEKIILEAEPEDQSFVQETLGYISDACRDVANRR